MMKTLHTSRHYLAYNHEKAGLIVQSTRKSGPADWPINKGINMQPTHPQYHAYVDALSTAIDTQEGDALCRALLSTTH
jgi:hypothetical protein